MSVSAWSRAWADQVLTNDDLRTLRSSKDQVTVTSSMEHSLLLPSQESAPAYCVFLPCAVWNDNSSVFFVTHWAEGQRQIRF